MFDEPVNGKIDLVGVNDLPEKVEISYCVKKIRTDEEAEAVVVLSGNAEIAADGVLKIESLVIAEGEKEFYLIQWEMGGQSFKNHYFTNIIDINYAKYMDALQSCGMDEFEGF